jgi:putative ABC transport system permease protein
MLVEAPMTVLDDQGHAAPDGRFGSRLVRFALANLARRPERSIIGVAGIGLAVAAVVVVRTIAGGYQLSGVEAVTSAIHGAPYWVVPEGGVRFDQAIGAVLPDGDLPDVTSPSGWSSTASLVGLLPGEPTVGLVGVSSASSGRAAMTSLARDRLGVRPGGTVAIAGTELTVDAVDGSGSLVTVPMDIARRAGVRSGWLTVRPPSGTTASNDAVAASTGLRVVSDPSIRPATGSGGLVYATSAETSRAGFVSFDQKFAAVLGAQVTSSVLGLVSQVGLLLGFVVAVTSFVAAVQERRREFGIMASIGLTDEVLYFFLVESLIIFVAAYVIGVLVGGAVVGLAVPSFFSVGRWLEASGIVAMYLPALAIVAALVPVHRLLQQRPVALLTDAP